MRKLLIIILIVLTVKNITNAQTDVSKAQSLFIYNFSRLTQWPENYSQGDFVIAVLGESPLFDQLKHFTLGKKVALQNIQIITYKTIDKVEPCNILFIPFDQSAYLTKVISKLNKSSTMIITEKNGSINKGAAINFVIIGNTLKYELSEKNATNCNIKINSRLKDMAFKVY